MSLAKKNFHITLILNDKRLSPYYLPLIEDVLTREDALCEQIPSLICEEGSITLVNKTESHAFKFFLEFVSRWLIFPEKLKISSLFSVDFRCIELAGTYSFSQVFFELPEGVKTSYFKERFALLQEEIKLGVQSEREAFRIMSIRGVTFEEKMLLIQDELSWLINRFPKLLSLEILQEFQHMLVLSPEIFRGERSSRHLCRLVIYQYLFKTWLKESPNEVKKWKVKVIRCDKGVLGIFVGVSGLNEIEVFDEKHLLGAIQQYLPDVKPVQDSFFSSRRGKNKVATFYLEVEKEKPFSQNDVTLLRRVLVDDLGARVESLMQPLFMPSNEEELMRNTMILSSQIKFMRDVPQVIISFQEQKAKELVFLVLLVRVKGPENPPVEVLLSRLESGLSCTLDRCKTVGVLRKKYTKEVANLWVCLPKEQFFRKDNSIDLYKARQLIVDELRKVLGEFRDYNGGMISKQNELLSAFRAQMGADVDELLSDNFFFSLMPVVMRTLLDPLALKTLYDLILSAILQAPYRREKHQVVFKQELKQIFACMTSDDSFLFEEMQRRFEKLYYQPTDLALASVVVGGLHYSGFLYRSDDPLKQKEFCTILERGVNDYTSSKVQECELVGSISEAI